MIYIVNVFSRTVKDLIIKSFECETADAAHELDVYYSVLGYHVALEPDTFAYMEKYMAPRAPKRKRRSPAPADALAL